MTLDELIAAAQAERARLGRGDMPVYPVLGNEEVGITTHKPDYRVPHIARDAVVGLALPVTSRDVQHGLYLAQRAMGDARAIRNGRIGRRLIRRAVTRRVASRVWRGW